jgi:MerR family mercuric resistance operon transcriptional regulator
LAKAANVGVETIRYYQRCSLLPLPERAYGSFRRYPHQSLQRLHFIRRAQALGFTLDEVRTLLQLNDGSACDTARTLAEHKLQVVEERLRDLKVLRTELRNLIGQCRANDGEVSCPLIHALGDAA